MVFLLIAKILLSCIILFAVLYFCQYLIDYFSWKTKLAHIPGTTYFTPAALRTPDHPDNFINNAYGQHENLSKFGSLWKLQFGRIPFVFITRATDSRKMLQTGFKQFDKSPSFIAISKFNWESFSVFSSQRDEWKRHRDLLNPSFSDNSLSDIFEKSILPQVDVLMKYIGKHGSNININEMFRLYTFDIICNAGFGSRTTCLIRNDSTTVDHTDAVLKNASAFAILPKWTWWLVQYLPFGAIRRFYDGFYPWRAFIRRVVREKGDEDNSDVLSRMRNAVLEGDRLTQVELIANSHVLLVAGHETTANTLIRMLYFLGYNQRACERVKKEAITFNPKKNTWDEFNEHFTYTRCVMYETLRMKSPAHLMARQSQEEVELDGYKVPAGVQIITLEFINCQDTEFWGKDANEFKPERFEGKDIRKMLYWPFSIGPRACIGKLMAEMEIISTVGTILSKYDIKVDPMKEKEWYEDKFEFTRKPKHDIFVNFVPR